MSIQRNVRIISSLGAKASPADVTEQIDAMAAPWNNGHPASPESHATISDELFDCMLAMRNQMPRGTALSTMDIDEMKEELAHRGWASV